MYFSRLAEFLSAAVHVRRSIFVEILYESCAVTGARILYQPLNT